MGSYQRITPEPVKPKRKRINEMTTNEKLAFLLAHGKTVSLVQLDSSQPFWGVYNNKRYQDDDLGSLIDRIYCIAEITSRQK